MKRLGLIVSLLLLAVPGAHAQAFFEQQVPLNPGWNAVFLEVEPQPVDIETALAGIPYASIWTWEARLGRVGVPPDPASGLLDRTGWFGRFPRTRPESIFNNLFALRANRAYLIKLDGTAPVLWTVRGRPLLRPRRWQPDSFNLTGFHVDPTGPPTFAAWAAPSPAHAGQPIYKLDPVGVWQLVTASETITSGAAYWVYSDGASRYQGPLEIDLGGADRLEFGASLTRGTVTLRNHLEVNVTASLSALPGPPPVPLSYRASDEVTNVTSWPALPDPLDVTVPAEDDAVVTVAVRRTDFPDRREQVLALGNGLGARRLLLVGANTTQSTTPSSLFEDTTAGQGTPPPPANVWAGLWVGTARVNGVSQSLRSCAPEICDFPQPASLPPIDTDPDNDNDCPLVDGICQIPCAEEAEEEEGTPSPPPSPPACAIEPEGYRPGPSCRSAQICAGPGETVATGKSFDLRLIIHVDSTGTARLLKEVIQLFKAPTRAPDPESPGFQRVVDPGEFVLLTDESLIPNFDGVAFRDGQPVGLRISTVAYDFDDAGIFGPDGTPFGEFIGEFDGSSSLNTTFNMERNFPTNPYRHKFHPDHDGLDARFLDPVSDEAPVIGRRIELDFKAAFDDPSIGFVDPLPEPPGWGADVVGGIYKERISFIGPIGTGGISGLHLQRIDAAGPFLLRRVAATPSLNDE